jgi:polyisoprenyl-phosphate glycosyltransferase
VPPASSTGPIPLVADPTAAAVPLAPALGPDQLPNLSVIVPMYNEAEVIPIFAARLRPVLDALAADGDSYEVLAVDDGSHDATPVLLERLRREWPQLRVLRLRANAGHQAALSAGLTRARGAWVATIDADLQDPPETLADMLAEARRAGVDVIYGVRSDRSTDSPFKRLTARLYYRAMRRMVGGHVPHDAGDFRLMSRATVEAVNHLPEQHRVLRLVVPALAFPSSQVPYKRAERAAGSTKYPLSRMLRLTVDSLTGFTIAPLRLATWFGLGGAAATALLLAFALVAWISGETVPGWASTVVAVSAVGTVQLLCLGMLGEYVGRLYTQVQGRPSYYVAYDSREVREEPGAVVESAAGGATVEAIEPSNGSLPR